MSSHSSSSDISSSESSSSRTSHDDLRAETPRKRRKLSEPEAENSDKEVITVPVPEAFASASTSRIKPRKSIENAAALAPQTMISNGKTVDATSSFATLGVSPWLIASLSAMAILRPTAIQKDCIPQLLVGRDVIGASRTGSGKTVAFAVPILQKWAEDPMGIYGLVLTPTRELALQIFEQFNAISAPQSLKAVLITGGTDMRTQALALSSRPHIVIATPGRLADHITTSGSDTISGLSRTRVLVLDEADRLLASGPGSMLPDVETCIGTLPPSTLRQTCLFTATLTPEVMALKSQPRAKDRPPVYISELDLNPTSIIPPKLTQTYLLVPLTHREAYLHILLLTPKNTAKKSIIIFCNRTTTANILERLLRALDHRITSLHSKLPQSERTANLSRFRASAARILVATDVASRGLDIPAVELVINYDVPRDPDDYIHRVGRTARAGRGGEAVTLVGQRDVELVLAIEGRVGRKMEEWKEDGVNVETRVVRDGVRDVGVMKREVLVGIEEGRDVRGRRTRGKIRRLE